MEKHYRLHPWVELLGRTLSNNLVDGKGSVPLGGYSAFTSVSDNSFRYLNLPVVVTVESNRVVIESDSAGQLALAESELKRICDDKSIPLLDGTTPSVVGVVAG